MATTKVKELSEELAITVHDYEGCQITSDRVVQWIEQFDKYERSVILKELNIIFGRLYFSKEKVRRLLHAFVIDGIVRKSPARDILSHTRFLQIQQKGNSQNELFSVLDQILKEEYSISLDECGKNPKLFIYVDDCICTGNRLKYDFTGGGNNPSWIQKQAPSGCNVLIYILAAHTAGVEYAKNEILKEAVKKNVTLTIFSGLSIDTKIDATSQVEFLWPEESEIARDDHIKSYVEYLNAEKEARKRYSIRLFRNREVPHEESFFSSAIDRQIVENAFLRVGTRIRIENQHLPPSCRPLGADPQLSLGLGTLFVTYRNIPNNCPLALWAGAKNWFPLFERRTNRQTEWQRTQKTNPFEEAI